MHIYAKSTRCSQSIQNYTNTRCPSFDQVDQSQGDIALKIQSRHTTNNEVCLHCMITLACRNKHYTTTRTFESSYITEPDKQYNKKHPTHPPTLLSLTHKAYNT